MKRLLTLILISAHLASTAQVIKTSIEESPKYLLHSINWSNRERTEFTDGDNIIQIQNTGNNLLQFGYTAKLDGQKHALILHKFDAQRNEIATNKLEKGEREFGPIRTVQLEFSHKLLLFYFRYMNKDSMKFYVSEIDKSDLSLQHTQLLYSYAQDNVGLLKLASALQGTIIPRISPDSSKLLIAYSNKKQTFTCVFDSRLNMLRKKTSIDLVGDDSEISDAYLENTGNNVLIISKISYARSNVPVALTGFIIQRIDNQEKSIDPTTLGEESRPINLHIKNNKDNSKLYLYGDYSDAVYANGVWVAELETQKFKINKPATFPYPDDFKKNVYKIGFGERRKGEYSILGIEYELVEFENGDIALCGNPVKEEDETRLASGTGTKEWALFYAGPVMVSFINKNRTTCNFALIPRNENLSIGSVGVFVPYHDKMIVFYNDYKKNIEKELLADDVHQSGGAVTKEMSLAYGIIKKDGSIQERKLIAEGVSRMNCYDTNNYLWLSSNKLLIPSTSLDKKTAAMRVAVITIE